MQWPAWQSGVAPEQTVPHAPQFIGSLDISAHAPLQAVSPCWQPHDPAVHVEPVGHVVPHAPQFAPSFDVSMHAIPHCVSPTAHAD